MASCKKTYGHHFGVGFFQLLENISQFFEETCGADVAWDGEVIVVEVVGFQAFDQDAKLVAVEDVTTESAGIARVVRELKQEISQNKIHNISHYRRES